jgi:hypothetical protein
VWIWQRPAARPALPEPRRELFRAARLRWLGQGEETGLRWDAFLAPPGAPLVEAVRSSGPLDWEQAREVLEALCDELVQAGQEGTLPERLSLSQVWVQPGGTVVLLEFPGAGARPTDPLGLLAEVALVLLGADPSGRDLPRRPLPLHVRELLADLPRFGGTVSDLPVFRDRLAATHERPTRVSGVLRLLHLLLLLGVQMLCCGCMVWTPLLLEGPIAAFGNVPMLHEADLLLAELERARAADAVLLAAPTLHPSDKWVAVTLLRRHQASHDELLAARDRARLYADVRRQGLVGGRLLPREWPGTSADAIGPFRPWQELPLEVRAGRMASQLRTQKGGDLAQHTSWIIGPLVLVGIAFLICAGGALLFRGGVRYLMFGVRLVRPDGRPAGRLRCAWRVLLAWLICVGPLVVARLLEEDAWKDWAPGKGPSEVLVLANVCWVAAGALLLLWLVVLFVNPARSLHDRLADTVLVPR